MCKRGYTDWRDIRDSWFTLLSEGADSFEKLSQHEHLARIEQYLKLLLVSCPGSFCCVTGAETYPV
jgi:hypothetical protein